MGAAAQRTSFSVESLARASAKEHAKAGRTGKLLEALQHLDGAEGMHFLRQRSLHGALKVLLVRRGHFEDAANEAAKAHDFEGAAQLLLDHAEKPAQQDCAQQAAQLLLKAADVAEEDGRVLELCDRVETMMQRASQEAAEAEAERVRGEQAAAEAEAAERSSDVSSWVAEQLSRNPLASVTKLRKAVKDVPPSWARTAHHV